MNSRLSGLSVNSGSEKSSPTSICLGPWISRNIAITIAPLNSLVVNCWNLHRVSLKMPHNSFSGAVASFFNFISLFDACFQSRECDAGQLLLGQNAVLFMGQSFFATQPPPWL